MKKVKVMLCLVGILAICLTIAGCGKDKEKTGNFNGTGVITVKRDNGNPEIYEDSARVSLQPQLNENGYYGRVQTGGIDISGPFTQEDDGYKARGLKYYPSYETENTPYQVPQTGYEEGQLGKLTTIKVNAKNAESDNSCTIQLSGGIMFKNEEGQGYFEGENRTCNISVRIVLSNLRNEEEEDK